jgi:DNA polymerase-3 subunit delta'
LFDVVGQRRALNVFSKSLSNDRVAHACIIIGPDGIGKSILAMHMAAALLCTGSNKPCGKCNSCSKAEKNIHPDIKVIASSKRSIGIDEVRDFIEEMYMKPYEGTRKVFIIKGAGTMTVQAQNAILKTLEEPPSDCVIIMLSESTEGLLDTILSRCQIIKLNRVSLDCIKDYLLEKGIDREKADMASRLSDGIIGNALKYCDDSFLKFRGELIDTAKKMVRNNIVQSFELAEYFSKNKNDIDEIFDMLTIWFRDIIVLKHVRDKDLIINKDCYDLLVEESGILSYNRLDRIMDEIKNIRLKLKQNANYQLSIEVMLLNIQEE